MKNQYPRLLILLLLTSCNQDVSNNKDNLQQLDTIIAPDYSRSLALKDSILLPDLLISGSCNYIVTEGDSCHFIARLSDSTFYKFYDERTQETHTLLPLVRIDSEEIEVNKVDYSASKYVKIAPPYETYSNSDKRYKSILFEWIFPHPREGGIKLSRSVRFELKNGH